MNEDKVFSAADMVAKLFSNIEESKLENGNQLVNKWRVVVESIYRNGKKLAAHSKVVDFKNGILLIETDHPGWTQMLQMYQEYILKGLRKNIPELNIVSLAFRLQGATFSLVEADEKKLYENEKKTLESQFKREDEILKKFDSKNESSEQKNKELPENLQNLFDRFRADMLTKNK